MSGESRNSISIYREIIRTRNGPSAVNFPRQEKDRELKIDALGFAVSGLSQSKGVKTLARITKSPVSSKVGRSRYIHRLNFE